MKQVVMDRLLVWWKLFHDGGPLMFPIFICSVTALAIIFERLWMLRRKRIIEDGLIKEAISLMKSGKYAEAKALLEASDTSMARVVIAGMSKSGHGRSEIREAMEDAGKQEGYNMSQFVNMLGGIAGITPLIGFLGTVYGMIISFNVIAQEGVGRAGEVAGGIAMALITTAAGLTVAVPSYIAYRYFLARVDNMLGQMEECSIKFLDYIAAMEHVEEDQS